MDNKIFPKSKLKGKSIVPLSTASSNVPGKTRAGGQSAQRFERLRDGAAKDFYKKIADLMKENFLGMDGLNGIIVGGPGPTKYDFVEGGYITTEVKNKIIAIKDLSYTGEFGLQELLDKSEDVLAEQEVMAEKRIVNKFFDTLATKPGKVGYGKEVVLSHLKNGVVDTLLLSEKVDDSVAKELIDIADKFGTNVMIISTDTREGVQLWKLGMIRSEEHTSELQSH